MGKAVGQLALDQPCQSLEDAEKWTPYMTPLTNTLPIRWPGLAPREPAELSLAYIRVGKTRAVVAVSFAGSPRSAEKPVPRKSDRPRRTASVPERCYREGSKKG